MDKKLVLLLVATFSIMMLLTAGCGSATTVTQTVTVPTTLTVSSTVTETVTITETPATATPQAPNTAGLGFSRDNPVPMGDTFLTPDGIQITVMNLITGQQAWEIIQEANMFNEAPSEGMQYVIITIKAKNISSSEEPYSLLFDIDLALIGSSNRVFNTYDRPVILADEGEFSDLDAELHHNGEAIGSLAFYVPSDETNLMLVESFLFKDYKIYYEVK